MYFKMPNKLFGIALLSFVVSLAGCAKTQFVVLRDVPESPSFVVIPANDYLHEVEFANEIEDAIISAGVKVVMRPATKDVTMEKIVQGAEGKQTDDVKSILAADAKLIERYSASADFDADYMVHTYETSQQVKIAKRETREILAVLEAPPVSVAGRKQSWLTTIYKALAKMGIPVAKKTE